MATLLGNTDSLKNTYYQRDWAEALPSLPEGWQKTGQHIAGLALPFVGILYQPAGRVISYTSTSVNSLYSLYQIFVIKTQKIEYLWNVLKNGAELAGMLAGIRIGLGLHTLINIGENLFSLRKFQTLSRSQVGENMVSVISNGLYLATLYNFSKKISYAVMGASLLFQACLNAYKAQQSVRAIKSWKDIKILDTAAHTGLSVVFFLKARTCYQEFTKIEQVIFRFRRPSMVKVEPIAAPTQPTVEKPSTEVTVPKATDSKEPSLPLNSDVEKATPSNALKDPVKHYRVKREDANESSTEASADLAKRWEILDRNLDKIAN